MGGVDYRKLRENKGFFIESWKIFVFYAEPGLMYELFQGRASPNIKR